MKIIICEGKYDAIFFDEITKNYIIPYTMYDSPFPQLQKCLGKSLNYLRSIYPLLIYGDGGKPDIYKILENTVAESLGKSDKNIYVNLILDDDGVDYEEFEETIKDRLEALSRNSNRFFYPPTFEQDDSGFILKYHKSEGSTIVNLFTIPLSLETQVAKKFIEKRCPHTSIIVEDDPHRAIDDLAREYYANRKDLLFRETSSFLKSEIWVDNVLKQINSS